MIFSNAVLSSFQTSTQFSTLKATLGEDHCLEASPYVKYNPSIQLFLLFFLSFFLSFTGHIQCECHHTWPWGCNDELCGLPPWSIKKVLPPITSSSLRSLPSSPTEAWFSLQPLNQGCLFSRDLFLIGLSSDINICLITTTSSN